MEKEAIGRQVVSALSLFNSGHEAFRGRVTELAIAFYRQLVLKTVQGLVFHTSLAPCPACSRRAPAMVISSTVCACRAARKLPHTLNNIQMLKCANPRP